MGVGAWVLAITTTAAPSDATPSLTWRAPLGCPTHEEVAASLAAQASPDDRTAQLSTDATVRETSAGKWAVTIAITSDAGEIRRELELDSCAAAAEAVALVYGLALAGEAEPATAEAPVEPPVSELPAEVVAPRVAAPEVRASEVDPSRAVSPPAKRKRPQVAIHFDGGGGVGTLPRGGGHVLLGVGPAWRRVRVGVRVDHAIARLSVDSSTDLGARISATTGGIEASIPIRIRRIELLPGLDLSVGGLRARGVGGQRRDTRWVPWVVAAGGMALVWMVGDPFGVRVGAAVEVPLVRHTFVFDALEVVRTRRVGGLFVVGLELRLPRLR